LIFAVAFAGCRRSPPPPAPAVVPPATVAPAPLPVVDDGPPPPRGVQISIIYSSNEFGEYKDCGCVHHPLGGVTRKGTIVAQARAEADGVLVVGAGDMLQPTARYSDMLLPNEGEVERRARLLIAALQHTGASAFLPGERDLAIGPALLTRLLRQAKIPVVAANLVDSRGKRLFDADRMVEIKGIKVGIFGVIRALPGDSAQWKAWGLDATDPEAAARAAVESLRQRGARIVVALVHAGNYEEAKTLVAAVPGIDWAVLGHSAMNLDTPELVGTARMLEAFTMGKHIGRLDLHVVNDGPTFADRGERAQIKRILADHQRQLGDLEARAATDKEGRFAAQFAPQRKALQDAIGRDTQLIATLPARIDGNWYENRIVEVELSLPEPPELAALVADYEKESKRRETAGKPVGIKPLVKSPTGALVDPTAPTAN